MNEIVEIELIFKKGNYSGSAVWMFIIQELGDAMEEGGLENSDQMRALTRLLKRELKKGDLTVPEVVNFCKQIVKEDSVGD